MLTVLAIDAGTTGVTALLVDDTGAVLAQGYREFPQHFPQPGWVEHDPEEIWQATLGACGEVLASDVLRGRPAPVAIGITNQRETLVVWDRDTLRAPRRAIVWQDRRTSAICDRLRNTGIENEVRDLTGLRLDPYFTGTKLTWLAESGDGSWEGVKSGQVRVGTVDSYLIARLSAGASYVTEPTNASRTLLYDLETGAWSRRLADVLGVPTEVLPEVVPSYGPIARTAPGVFHGLSVPVTGVAGDQQAAMVGQACFSPGDAKCTYGTGSFLLVHTGDKPVRSSAGLLTTVALGLPDGTRTYALEGSVFVSGAAVQWLRDGLGLIESAAETEELAASVPDSGGVVFVPALTGLGAPHWDPEARGAIVGITRGTTAAHVVRATLEAIALSVADVVGVLEVQPQVLRVDGGASANNLLMQLQADTLDTRVERPAGLQTTGLGAAFLAGVGAGVWSSLDEVAGLWRTGATFDPAPADAGLSTRWQAAVERSKGWAGVL